MNTSLECLPCFVRQGLEAVGFVSGDAAFQERVLRALLVDLSAIDLSQPPPVIAQQVHRRLRELTGVADPYSEIKTRQNAAALSVLPRMRDYLRSSADPLLTGVRLAIAGNAIDSGVSACLLPEEIPSAIESALAEPFAGEIEHFRAVIQRARRILYLADNAGEIAFDRLLIELLPAGVVTVAVRGHAVLNDALRADAVAVGLADLVEIIDNGSDAPGTLLNDCSAEFVRSFCAADLVIAKGQGNYETLSQVDAPVTFLLKAKCPVIAKDLRAPVGSHVLWMPNRE